MGGNPERGKGKRRGRGRGPPANRTTNKNVENILPVGKGPPAEKESPVEMKSPVGKEHEETATIDKPKVELDPKAETENLSAGDSNTSYDNQQGKPEPKMAEFINAKEFYPDSEKFMHRVVPKGRPQPREERPGIGIRIMRRPKMEEEPRNKPAPPEKRLEQNNTPRHLSISTDMISERLAQAGIGIELIVPKNYPSLAAKSRYKECLESLCFYVNPVERALAPEITLDRLLVSSINKRRKLEADDVKLIETLAVPPLQANIIKYWKSLNLLKFASTGFCHNDGFGHFPEDLLTVDWRNELKVLDSFVHKFINSPIILGDFEMQFNQEKKRVDGILKLIEGDQREELKKMNIHYAASPLIRLKYDAPVTEEEIFDVIRKSVTTDYGYFLWLVENKPRRLLKRADLVECVIGAMHGKLLSKDHRLIAAQITIIPQMLASLSPEEKEAISKKFVDNREVKIENWPDFLLPGYKMLRSKVSHYSRGEDCVVTAKLLDSETSDELAAFLFFCILISELGEGRFKPVLGNSTDSFCTRIARVLVRDIPAAKKELLLEALMSLPRGVQAYLLAEDDNPLQTSLYSTFDMLFTNKVNIERLIHALELLCKHISPVRIVKTFLIPGMTSAPVRAAGVLKEVVKLEKFREEMLSSSHLSPADFCKLAIEQYAEPDAGIPQKRYSFMEELLHFIDSILETNVDQKLVESVDMLLSERNLTWYQTKAILTICFPKSKTKFAQPEIPSIRNTIESLREAKLTSVLNTWPDPDKVQPIFEDVMKDIMSHMDSAKLAYVLMNAVVEEGSKIQSYKKYISEFIHNNLVGKDVMGIPQDTGGQSGRNKEHDWLKEILGSRTLNQAVREAVVSVACRMKAYEKLAHPVKKKYHRNHNNRANKSLSRENETAPAQKSRSGDQNHRGRGRAPRGHGPPNGPPHGSARK